MKNMQKKKISQSYHLLRDRSLIKSRGGGGGGFGGGGGGGGGGCAPIIAYTWRLRPKRVPRSGFRVAISQVEVYERAGNSVNAR